MDFKRINAAIANLRQHWKPATDNVNVYTKPELYARMVELLDICGLEGWVANIQKPKRGAEINSPRINGRCNYVSKTISINESDLPVKTKVEIENTLIHEVAHALTQGDGHGSTFRRVADAMGGNSRATASTSDYKYREMVKLTSFKWVCVVLEEDQPLEIIDVMQRKKDYSNSYIAGRPETKGKLVSITSAEYIKRRADLARRGIQEPIKMPPKR
ncbi:hypothetical protein EniLVp02_0077 [Vibrio phage EniLVp02]